MKERMRQAFTRRVKVTLLFFIVIVLACTSISIGKSNYSTHHNQSSHLKWVGGWEASPQAPRPFGFSQQGFFHQTIRLVIHPHLSGEAVRLTFSNIFGQKPVTFGQVHIAISSKGNRIIPGTDHPVTFAGHPSVTLPAGGQVKSDVIPFKVINGRNLTVSIYIPERTGPATWHALSNQIAYVSNSGNHAQETSGTAYKTKLFGWYWLSGVDIQTASSVPGVIVALGDSITDGLHSSINSNHRWPDYFAERLSQGPLDQQYSVLNAGISGNRILVNSLRNGVSARTRLQRDVLSQTGVTDVIFLEGINDIGKLPHTYDANKIIAGMKTIIKQVHAKGLTIYGGTLTPFQGKIGGYYTEQGERTREQVNHWIRTSGAFDGVIDFDKALRDPNHPHRLLSRYDSGDHLHPSDLGYQAMANAAYLTLFDRKHHSPTP
ncbi:SGNH hydrolase [Pullulanibacillus camelliae]|uniref:SGNH hydrolase n=1 Tax=Pullulanibacillus camelliae TaxID=1707096 RepID=A0A8J2VLM9_9BACL|nr:SGNH/GDSL hydrolase family protein [Pullulanibacillus camelliae]GGE30848.1 SGNH hydrolase [Pullulanibacillus camelliae]